MSKFPRFLLTHTAPSYLNYDFRHNLMIINNNNKKDKYINKELTIISNTSHHVLVPVL